MAKRGRKPKGAEPHPHGDDLRELGNKQRAGQALSELIRSVGTELTEIVQDTSAGTPGPPRIISKAEALARQCWERALPSTDEDGTVTPGSIDYVKIVLDRSDGRPGSNDGKADDDGKESVPERVSRLNRERLNTMAADVTGDVDGNSQATA